MTLGPLHIIVSDLLLPAAFAGESSPVTPVLRKLLARADCATLPFASQEMLLCSLFGISDGAIAPVMAQADGVATADDYWLCAAPVYLQIQHDRLILHPPPALSIEEATRLCDDLNAHFTADGLRFTAPHPQRWYLQLKHAPAISTHPLPEVIGRDVLAFLPHGDDALHWHKLINEMQMYLHEHAVNQQREARGAWPVNSLWLWGGGYAPNNLTRPAQQICADDAVALALSQAAGVPHAPLPLHFEHARHDAVLVVWDRMRQAVMAGDVDAWRDALEQFEAHYARPIFSLLRNGMLKRVTLDVVQDGKAQRYSLDRRSVWRFWRRG
jgi:hypothetical protein